ncbi:hypothetical protein C6503_24140 [Candidatus Poribacteria bacterium]|nr:MAG: hypothetical protein C6503_24140 [Candidatus Poribacteria bacterium]
MAVSNLPTRNAIHQPLLDLLSDGKEHHWSDIVEKLAAHFSLTDTELNEEVPSGQKRFYHRCSFAIQDLKKDGFVESPKRAYWKITKRGNDRQKRQNRITPTKKETRENPLQATSKTLSSNVSKSLHVPHPIRKESTKDKKSIIRTRSRSRSYGKKLTEQPGQKQRAIERARVRDVETVETIQEPKPIEKVTPTEKKIPWRAPRSKNKFDPGTYACQTIFYGICGLFFFQLPLSSSLWSLL